MSLDAMDNFVFCIASKKTAARLVKEMSDLVCFSTFIIFLHIQLIHKENNLHLFSVIVILFFKYFYLY